MLFQGKPFGNRKQEKSIKRIKEEATERRKEKGGGTKSRILMDTKRGRGKERKGIHTRKKESRKNEEDEKDINSLRKNDINNWWMKKKGKSRMRICKRNRGENRGPRHGSSNRRA